MYKMQQEGARVVKTGLLALSSVVAAVLYTPVQYR